jgi:hypothetical protein
VSAPEFSDVGLRPVPPEMLERLGPAVNAWIAGMHRVLKTLTASLPANERTFVLRSIYLSLCVQRLAIEPPAMRAHLLAELPRLVEVEVALAERGGRAVS